MFGEMRIITNHTLIIRKVSVCTFNLGCRKFAFVNDRIRKYCSIKRGTWLGVKQIIYYPDLTIHILKIIKLIYC